MWYLVRRTEQFGANRSRRWVPCGSQEFRRGTGWVPYFPKQSIRGAEGCSSDRERVLTPACSAACSAGSGEGGPLKSRDELIREIEVLRDRISRLTAASLPVSTVLREVINSARVLTALVWCHCDRRRFGAGPRLRHLQFRGQRAPTDGELARRAAKLRALPRPAGNTADARQGMRSRSPARAATSAAPVVWGAV